MAYNIKTAVKLFIIFVYFQLVLNAIVLAIPVMNNNISQDDINYMDFINTQTNPSYYFNGKPSDADTTNLLQNFVDGMPSANTFNDSVLNTFLGIYKIIASAIEFLVKLIISSLFVPSVMMNILLFNFVGNTSLLISGMVLVNIGFYAFMYYVVFKEGVK